MAEAARKQIVLEWLGGLGMVARNEAGRAILVGTPPPERAGEILAGLDVPHSGLAPMELVLVALGGCTGLDVISILEKMRQRVETFTVVAEGERATEHPKVYITARVTYRLAGEIEPANARRAAELSIQRYCSVGAMLTRAVPVTYALEVNGELTDLGTRGPDPRKTEGGSGSGCR
ncbi:MAG: OsmC family protein [Bacillota bacterium]|nr:OsmC family protein [Bacillota bacterium]